MSNSNRDRSWDDDDDDQDDWDDDAQGDWDEDGPDELDYGNDDDEPMVPCPYCRREILEEAERCPYCEQYISAEDAPKRVPWWIILGVVAALLAVYAWSAR